MKSNENKENQTSVGITLTSHHDFTSDVDEVAWNFLSQILWRKPVSKKSK